MENKHLVKRFGAIVGKLGIPFKVNGAGEMVYRASDYEQITKAYKEFKAKDLRANNYCSGFLGDDEVIWVETYSGKLLEPHVWAESGEKLTSSQVADLNDEMNSKADRDQDSWSPKTSPEETHREKVELKGAVSKKFKVYKFMARPISESNPRGGVIDTIVGGKEQVIEYVKEMLGLEKVTLIKVENGYAYRDGMFVWNFVTQ